jgi:hypothetical protein
MPIAVMGNASTDCQGIVKTVFSLSSLQLHVYGYSAASEETFGTPPTKLIGSCSASLNFFCLVTVVGQGHTQLPGDDENSSGRQAQHLHSYKGNLNAKRCN